MRTTNSKLNDTALRAAEKWKFKPSRLKGVSIATIVAQEIEFKSDLKPASLTGKKIVFYQVDEITKERVEDLERFARYVKTLEAMGAAVFKGARTPEAFDVVLAVRPGHLSRVWIDHSASYSAIDRSEELKQAFETVLPPKVQGGPVVISLSVSVLGARGNLNKISNHLFPAIPEEWKKAVHDSGAAQLDAD